MDEQKLTFVENDATQDFREGNARWVVKLNNDSMVYCFDKHDEESDWTKLKRYCEANELYVVEMYLHFRSNHVSLPGNKDGYFFRRGILGGLTMDHVENYMYAGYLENGQIVVNKYRVPEMLIQYTELREIENNENSLIRKPI